MRIKRNNESSAPSISFGKVGNVSIGKKAKNNSGIEYPTSVDHFIFRSDFAKHVSDAEGVYGKECNHLDILFYSDEPGICCDERLELRDSGGRLLAYGDGEVFHRSTEKGWVIDRASEIDGYMQKFADRYSTGKYVATWDEVLYLRFILMNTPNIGYWEFRTKGKDTTIPQIVSVFDSCISQWGTASRVPFSLLVKKHKSNRANVNRQYPVVSLVLNLSVEALENIKLLGNKITGILTDEKLLSHGGNSDVEIKLIQ